MIEVLRCFGDLRFGLYRLFQGADRGIRRDFERKKVAIVMRRSCYIQSDAPLEESQSEYVGLIRGFETQTFCRLDDKQDDRFIRISFGGGEGGGGGYE